MRMERDMFVGWAVEQLIKTAEKENKDVNKFRNQASAAYIECAKQLQQKYHWTIRGHFEGSKGLKSLSQLLNHFLRESEQNDVIFEINKFQVDNKLPEYSAESDFVAWWTQVFKTNTYPALSKMITEQTVSVMSIFHGPQVESSFNLMGDVDIRSTRMKTETLSAVQTTKYAFKARKTTALQYFNGNDVKKDTVWKGVCVCLRKAASEYKKRTEKKTTA